MPNKGYKITEQHRLNLRKSHLGQFQEKLGENKNCLFCNKEFYVKRDELKMGWGKYCSAKCRTDFRKGKPITWFKNIKYKSNSGSFKKGFIPWNKNIKGYSTSKKGVPQYHLRGEKNKLYNGYGKERDRWGKRIESINWRKEVFKYDKHTCWICGVVGTNLNAHHLKSWVKYPELRIIISNGITLCRFCHKTYTNFNENHKYN